MQCTNMDRASTSKPEKNICVVHLCVKISERHGMFVVGPVLPRPQHQVNTSTGNSTCFRAISFLLFPKRKIDKIDEGKKGRDEDELEFV